MCIHHVISRFRVKSCAGPHELFHQPAQENEVPHEDFHNGALFCTRKWTVPHETLKSSHEIFKSLREVFLQPARRNKVPHEDSRVQALSCVNRKESSRENQESSRENELCRTKIPESVWDCMDRELENFLKNAEEAKEIDFLEPHGGCQKCTYELWASEPHRHFDIVFT